MTQDWQNLTAAALVVAAGAYLVRQTWLVLARKKASGCGSCAKCPGDAATTNGQSSVSMEVVSVEALVKSASMDETARAGRL